MIQLAQGLVRLVLGVPACVNGFLVQGMGTKQAGEQHTGCGTRLTAALAQAVVVVVAPNETTARLFYTPHLVLGSRLHRFWCTPAYPAGRFDLSCSAYGHGYGTPSRRASLPRRSSI